MPTDTNKDPIALLRRLKMFWLFFFTSEVTALLFMFMSKGGRTKKTHRDNIS